MSNIFYVQEYAQMIESEQEESRIKELVDKVSHDTAVLYDLPYEDLEKMVHWLEDEVRRKSRILSEKQLELQSLERKTKKLYTASPVKEKITMNRDISELGLSVRAYNCLKQVGVSTIGGLCRKSNDELECVHGMNKRIIDEIKEKVHDFGLTLKDETEQRITCSQDADYDSRAELERKFEELFGTPWDEEDQ